MQKVQHLYLFTLEVEPLMVGKTYNPLPSHLTLISRFYSHESSENITTIVNDLFGHSKSIELLFENSTTLGSKQTPVHIIESSQELIQLHEQLSKILDQIGVVYTQPQFIRSGWKPHVSKREDDNFTPGVIHSSKSVCLIEVFIKDGNQLRIVRQKYKLAGRASITKHSHTQLNYYDL